jgi:hypothetical protein
MTGSGSLGKADQAIWFLLAIAQNEITVWNTISKFWEVNCAAPMALEIMYAARARQEQRGAKPRKGAYLSGWE